MGYTHGNEWTAKNIEQGIKEVMEKLELKTMPTKSMICEINGNTSLNNAISRSGGTIEWSKKLGIKHMGSETVVGRKYENICSEYISNKFDFDVENMNSRHPYDILVNKNIKIDVKASHMYKSAFTMYTFNLEKRHPTCDLFVAYCIDDSEKIVKTYIIPSKITSGIKQLSVGINQSKYDKYLDRWDFIKIYDEFYKTLE